MSYAVFLLIAVPLFSTQENTPKDEIRSLVRKLRSESMEEREQATDRLLKIGPSCRTALQRLFARETDAEARARIGAVLSEFRFVTLKETRAEKSGTFGGHFGAESCLFSPDGKILVTSGNDGKVKFLRVPDFAEIATFDLKVESYSNVVGSFSRDSKLLLVGDESGYLDLIDVARRKIKSRVRMPDRSRSLACALSPDGRFAVGKGYGGPVALWDREAETCVPADGMTDRSGAYLTQLLFSSMGRYLAYPNERG